MDEKREALQTIIDVTGEIGKVDDNIITELGRQKIVLFNLRIQTASIKENHGILPIIEELNRSINSIEESIKALTQNNRGKLVEAITVVSNYINE